MSISPSRIFCHKLNDHVLFSNIINLCFITGGTPPPPKKKTKKTYISSGAPYTIPFTQNSNSKINTDLQAVSKHWMISNKNHRIPCHTLSKQFKKAANNSNDFQTLCKNQKIPCHTFSKQFKKAANNSNDFQTLRTIFKHLLSWMIHQIQIIFK